jgi:lipopolysaccharide transport system permease protein
MHDAKDKKIVIRPPVGFGELDFGELYRYRHMLMSLVQRDIKTQFDDMKFGILWALVRPLSVAMVFALFKSYSGAKTFVQAPYMMFVYSGLIFWYYFTDTTMQAAGSVRKDAAIISKIYFPRLITPMVPIFANLAGLTIASIPLIIMMGWYQSIPSWNILLLPIVLLHCMALIFGLGMLFAAISISNKDMEQFLSLLMYLGLFVSCIFFVPEMLPEKKQTLLMLNPMAGIMLAFRACILEGFAFPIVAWSYSLLFTIATVIVGGLAFRRAETSFVDKL